MPSDPPPSPPHELHYAPRPPLHQRWAWRISVLCGFIALGLVLYSWSPVLIRHYRLLYWQRQCLDAAAPPDQIINQINDPSTTKPVPFVFQQWINFSAAYGPISGGASLNGTIFLHRMRRPDKVERLVAVDLYVFKMDSFQIMTPYAGVYSIGGLLSSPQRLTPLSSQGFSSGLFRNHIQRIYAGQLDPTDESHFTYVMEIDNKKTTYDGYLKSDDSVVIEPRSEPATSPSAQ